MVVDGYEGRQGRIAQYEAGVGGLAHAFQHGDDALIVPAAAEAEAGLEDPRVELPIAVLIVDGAQGHVEVVLPEQEAGTHVPGSAAYLRGGRALIPIVAADGKLRVVLVGVADELQSCAEADVTRQVSLEVRERAGTGEGRCEQADEIPQAGGILIARGIDAGVGRARGELAEAVLVAEIAPENGQVVGVVDIEELLLLGNLFFRVGSVAVRAAADDGEQAGFPRAVRRWRWALRSEKRISSPPKSTPASASRPVKL